MSKVERNDTDWKKRLTPEEYYVTRQCGTEPPFTGRYYDHHETGVYLCVCCSAVLFRSDDKFDSGSGWPSFFAPAAENALKRLPDHSLGMSRVELRCAGCDAHLGHVFEDGPRPTGQRFCINGAALEFKPKADGA